MSHGVQVVGLVTSSLLILVSDLQLFTTCFLCDHHCRRLAQQLTVLRINASCFIVTYRLDCNYLLLKISLQLKSKTFAQCLDWSKPVFLHLRYMATITVYVIQ